MTHTIFEVFESQDLESGCWGDQMRAIEITKLEASGGAQTRESFNGFRVFEGDLGTHKK
jgi:hypothetical protein